jgi:hypothetical protein
MRFDMMRVRQNGWVVPRHNAGMLRIVRGAFHLDDKNVPELRRTSRVASFHVDGGNEVLQLYDAGLMKASSNMMVISGFEREDNGARVVDYAQTWILVECEGEVPEPSRGPAFPR